MKKGSFFRKKPMDTAGMILLNGTIRGVGVVSAAYGVNYVAPLILKRMPRHFLGLGCWLIGMAGEVFVQQEQVNAWAQGLSSYGFYHFVTSTVLKDKAADFGLTLNGLGKPDASDNEEKSTAEMDEVYRKSLGNNPLDELNKDLDKLLEKQLNGFDDFDNLPNNAAKNGAGTPGMSVAAGGSAVAKGNAVAPIAGLDGMDTDYLLGAA